MSANILLEICKERAEQDRKWGGSSHDDEHDGLDWLNYLLEHAAKALSGFVRTERHPGTTSFHDRAFTFTVHIPAADARNPRAYRKQLIRVAALAVAAVESFDRKHGAPSAADGNGAVQPPNTFLTTGGEPPPGWPTKAEIAAAPVNSVGTCKLCGYHGPGPGHDCPKAAAGDAAEARS